MVQWRITWDPAVATTGNGSSGGPLGHTFESLQRSDISLKSH